MLIFRAQLVVNIEAYPVVKVIGNDFTLPCSVGCHRQVSHSVNGRWQNQTFVVVSMLAQHIDPSGSANHNGFILETILKT